MLNLKSDKGKYLMRMIRESNDAVPALFDPAVLAFNISVQSIQLNSLIDVLESKQVIPAGAVDVEFNVRLSQFLATMERTVNGIDSLLRRDVADRTGERENKP